MNALVTEYYVFFLGLTKSYQQCKFFLATNFPHP